MYKRVAWVLAVLLVACQGTALVEESFTGFEQPMFGLDDNEAFAFRAQYFEVSADATDASIELDNMLLYVDPFYGQMTISLTVRNQDASLPMMVKPRYLIANGAQHGIYRPEGISFYNEEWIDNPHAPHRQQGKKNILWNVSVTDKTYQAAHIDESSPVDITLDCIIYRATGVSFAVDVPSNHSIENNNYLMNRIFDYPWQMDVSQSMYNDELTTWRMLPVLIGYDHPNTTACTSYWFPFHEVVDKDMERITRIHFYQTTAEIVSIPFQVDAAFAADWLEASRFYTDWYATDHDDPST